VAGQEKKKWGNVNILSFRLVRGVDGVKQEGCGSSEISVVVGSVAMGRMGA
jgi:hypothetical protein